MRFIAFLCISIQSMAPRISRRERTFSSKFLFVELTRRSRASAKSSFYLFSACQTCPFSKILRGLDQSIKSIKIHWIIRLHVQSVTWTVMIILCVSASRTSLYLLTLTPNNFKIDGPLIARSRGLKIYCHLRRHV